jgi:Tol biopolymer transport system component
LRLTTDPAEDGRPTWSPDGRQIAFLRFTPGRQAIYLIPPLGGPERRIAEFARVGRGFLIGRVAWSPDGKFLVFSKSQPERSPRSIYVLSLDTG